MVTTKEIAPASMLAPFVRCYTYREFNTYGFDVVKPWHASNELYFPFFFGDLPVKMITTDGKIIYGKNAGSVGIVTRYMGDMTFNGNYSFLSIQFKPSGFNKIFGLPSGEFTNDIIGADDFLSPSVRVLYEQLVNAKTLLLRTALLDTYLLSFLKKQRYVDGKDAITCLSNMIIKNVGLTNIMQLSYAANMSVRNFERHFNNQVGVSPKLFCRLTRFDKAFNFKLKKPHKDWTSIAIENGYYDQMHLVKDCREFTGLAPSAFINDTPLLEKDFSNRLNDNV